MKSFRSCRFLLLSSSLSWIAMPGVASATNVRALPIERPASLSMQCFLAAGARYRIDPLLLYAIADVESSLNAAATNENRDGSVDYGLMQVNSRHLPRLKRQGIDANRLLTEPCLAVHTGASILADIIARHGYTWMAVGAYNAGGGSGRGELRQRYATKVWRRYSSLSSTRPAPAATPSAQSGLSGANTPMKGFSWRADGIQFLSFP